MIRVTLCRNARLVRPLRPYKGLFIYRCETKLGLLDRSQSAHSVEHRKDGHTYISEDCHPHSGYTEQCEEQYQYLDTYGKPSVLERNADRTACYAYGGSDLERVVIHNDYVGRLYGSVRAKSTHSDTHIGTR